MMCTLSKGALRFTSARVSSHRNHHPNLDYPIRPVFRSVGEGCGAAIPLTCNLRGGLPIREKEHGESYEHTSVVASLVPFTESIINHLHGAKRELWHSPWFDRESKNSWPLSSHTIPALRNFFLNRDSY